MAIALTGLEAGAIAGVEHGFASIGDEHDRAPDDIDELIFVSVPMALTGLGARAQLQQIDAELDKARGQPESTPGLVLAGFVERLGIARPGARTDASNIDLHVPISRRPVSVIFSRSGCPAARARTRRSSPRSNFHDGTATRLGSSCFLSLTQIYEMVADSP